MSRRRGSPVRRSRSRPRLRPRPAPRPRDRLEGASSGLLWPCWLSSSSPSARRCTAKRSSPQHGRKAGGERELQIAGYLQPDPLSPPGVNVPRNARAAPALLALAHWDNQYLGHATSGVRGNLRSHFVLPARCGPTSRDALRMSSLLHAVAGRQSGSGEMRRVTSHAACAEARSPRHPVLSLRRELRGSASRARQRCCQPSAPARVARTARPFP